MHFVAARRTLRLALGGSLCLAFSQACNWPLSYVAPILSMMILGLPLPALRLKQGMALLAAMLLPLILGMGLLPLLLHARWAGIALLGLLLFHLFYFTARGGSALLGTFMTIGLTVVVTVGSVSPTLLQLLLPGLSASILCGVLFSRLAHELLPDPPLRAPPPRPPGDVPAAPEARRRALRSLFVVLPLTLLFLFASGSPGFTPVMIKSAALGQEASAKASRRMGLSLLASTFWGGLAAIIAWQLLSIWPSLLLLTLLTALLCLFAGRWIFSGPALHPRASEMSYALVTYVILIAPAVMDSPMSSSAGEAFWTRLALFALVAVYGTVSVRVFDAFCPGSRTPGLAPPLSAGAVQ